MRTLTKTIEKADYEALSSQIYLLRQAATELSAANCFIEVGNEARFWEYSMAMQALMDWLIKRPAFMQNVKMVDVGAGDGLLGPTLALKANYGIDEIDPRVECAMNRRHCNHFLDSKNLPGIQTKVGSLTSFPDEWDVVFCISVAEHVRQQNEFWQSLADAVKPNGLLFMTVDVVPLARGKYVFDNLRAVNYTPDVLRTRGEWLVSQGFKWFGGEPDWEFHGAEVHDYSFMSLCLVKGQI